jgi:hypothetical protein
VGAQADTTEDAEVEQEREYKTNWYDEPRQKRKCTEKTNTKRRRSPRLQSTHNLPVVPEEEQEGETQNKTPQAFAEHIEQEIPEQTKPTDGPPIRLHQPAMISQEALNAMTRATWNNSMPAFTPDKLRPLQQLPPDIEHFCAPVTHPTTGKLITSYKELARDPITKDV